MTYLFNMSFNKTSFDDSIYIHKRDRVCDNIINNPSELTVFQRDIKLRSITGDLNFKVNEDRLKELPLNIIRYRHTDAIITGSSVLYLFDLLDRKQNDFDILVDIKPNMVFEEENNNISLDDNRIGYNIQFVPSSISLLNNLLGFLLSINFINSFYSFFKKKISVDYFINYNKNFIEYELDGFTYKLHNPSEIIDMKIEMIKKSLSAKKRSRYLSNSSSKHIEDIVHLRFKIGYEF